MEEQGLVIDSEMVNQQCAYMEEMERAGDSGDVGEIVDDSQDSEMAIEVHVEFDSPKIQSEI